VGAAARYRGTVVERGTEDGHASGRPVLSEAAAGGRVWRVRYDDDGLVRATPERFLSVVSGGAPKEAPVRANSWMAAEEAVLRSLVGELGNRWTEISRRLGTGRSKGAVDQHWKLMCEKETGPPRRLCDKWTPEEEAYLRTMVGAAGHPGTQLGVDGWADITDRLGTGRTPTAVERHWQLMRQHPPTAAAPDKRAPPQKTCPSCHAKVHARKARCDCGHASGARDMGADVAPASARPFDNPDRRRQEAADAALARRLQEEEEEEEEAEALPRPGRASQIHDSPPPPLPRQVTMPPVHRLLALTQAADASPLPVAPDAADAPPRRIVLPEQLPPRWAAIVASQGEGVDLSWIGAMREELSCPICMDAVEWAVQVPCGHVFCSDCLA